MPSKNFDREDMSELVCGGYVDTLTLIEDEVVDTTRWSIIHDIVFRDEETGNYYGAVYSVGATEYQDEAPFEFDDDEVTCYQVEPVEVTVTQYRRVKEEG